MRRAYARNVPATHRIYRGRRKAGRQRTAANSYLLQIYIRPDACGISRAYDKIIPILHLPHRTDRTHGRYRTDRTDGTCGRSDGGRGGGGCSDDGDDGGSGSRSQLAVGVFACGGHFAKLKERGGVLRALPLSFCPLTALKKHRPPAFRNRLEKIPCVFAGRTCFFIRGVLQ